MIHEGPALVVGLGSIGVRHQSVLSGLGLSVCTVSRREGLGDFRSITEAIGVVDPAYVVIATETDQHLRALNELVDTGFDGRVLVEKPYADCVAEPVDHCFRALGVGYHLRFHPAVRAFRSALGDSPVLSAQVKVGSHLSDWRPSRDYRTTESAGPGGGVLLDLSHELDLVRWLLGPGTVRYGETFRSGTLEIENEDIAVGVIRLADGGPVCVEMNYLDRVPTRTFLATTSEATVALDLISGFCTVDGLVLHGGLVDRDAVYRSLHLAMLDDDPDICRASEAIEVLEWISAIRGGLHECR